MPISHEKGENYFEIHSLVSSRTGEGVVEMVWGDKRAQFTCEEARQQGNYFFECAEAAESDAFIVEFFESLGRKKEEAIGLLRHFRTFRETRDKKH